MKHSFGSDDTHTHLLTHSRSPCVKPYFSDRVLTGVITVFIAPVYREKSSRLLGEVLTTALNPSVCLATDRLTQQQERDSASADVGFSDKVARENAAIPLSDQRCEQYNQL